MKNQQAVNILKQLKGKKFLVRGNHDKINDDMKKYFVSIEPYMKLNDNGRMVIASHYPIAHWDGQFRGSYHVYAHIHTNQDSTYYEFYKEYCISKGLHFNAYNTGAMMDYMNYTPRTLDYIIEHA